MTPDLSHPPLCPDCHGLCWCLIRDETDLDEPCCDTCHGTGWNPTHLVWLGVPAGAR